MVLLGKSRSIGGWPAISWGDGAPDPPERLPEYREWQTAERGQPAGDRRDLPGVGFVRDLALSSCNSADAQGREALFYAIRPPWAGAWPWSGIWNANSIGNTCSDERTNRSELVSTGPTTRFACSTPQASTPRVE